MTPLRIALAAVFLVAWGVALAGLLLEERLLLEGGVVAGLGAVAPVLLLRDRAGAAPAARAPRPARPSPAAQDVEFEVVPTFGKAPEKAPSAPAEEPRSRIPVVAAAAPRREGPVPSRSLVGAEPATTERLTRGVCGQCGSTLSLSSRRPIRATCPMCGRSKILE